MKPIAILDTEASDALPDVPTIVSANAAYDAYLPWGPFFGVFVKNDTPEEAVNALTEAYATAAQNANFVKLMDDRGFTMMNISGQEAQDFLTKWQQNTAWLMQDAGLTQASPEEFGIEKPAK